MRRLARRGFVGRIVRANVLSGHDPGVEDGEVGRDDGEEEKEDSDDLRDVERAVSLQVVGEDSQGDERSADDDTRYRLGPGLVMVGKHRGTPFSIDGMRRPFA
jgi:hypothetical protein